MATAVRFAESEHRPAPRRPIWVSAAGVAAFAAAVFGVAFLVI